MVIKFSSPAVHIRFDLGKLVDALRIEYLESSQRN